MCKINERDIVSLVKHVLGSLMNMSQFLYEIVIIKKN